MEREKIKRKDEKKNKDLNIKIETILERLNRVPCNITSDEEQFVLEPRLDLDENTHYVLLNDMVKAIFALQRQNADLSKLNVKIQEGNEKIIAMFEKILDNNGEHAKMQEENSKLHGNLQDHVTSILDTAIKFESNNNLRSKKTKTKITKLRSQIDMLSRKVDSLMPTQNENT